MQQESDTITESSEPTIAMFVAICAKHLEHAISESRTEMDNLTMAVISNDTNTSADVMARLQSIDRFMQRLNNVKSNLDHLTECLQVSDSLPDLENLVTEFRSSYTMPSERELFDAMIGQTQVGELRSDDEVMLF